MQVVQELLHQQSVLVCLVQQIYWAPEDKMNYPLDVGSIYFDDMQQNDLSETEICAHERLGGDLKDTSNS